MGLCLCLNGGHLKLSCIVSQFRNIHTSCFSLPPSCSLFALLRAKKKQVLFLLQDISEICTQRRWS